MIEIAKEYYQSGLSIIKNNLFCFIKIFVYLQCLILILCTQRKLTYSPKANVTTPYSVGIKPFVVGDIFFMKKIGVIHDSCVYKIVSKKTKKCYIGSAKDFNKRKSVHLWHLKKGSHHSAYLQNHVNKYGLDDISFEILDFVDIVDLVNKEQYYIDLFNPEFNISKFAYSTIGVRCSEEKKELLRKIHTGRKATPAAIEANRLGQLKRLPPTEETRKKLSESNRGKIVSEESKLNNLFSQKTRREVICIDTNTKYPSIRAASRDLNIPKEQIRYVCEGKHRHARKLKFKFA